MKTRLTFLLLCIGYGLFAQSFDRTKMNQLLSALEAGDKAMFGLSVMEKGEIVYQNSIGYAQVDSKMRPNADTQYRIGSITKVFTATMIFQLIEEGKLSVESKLSEFYPNVKNAEKITISHLLTHSSGIFNVTNRPEFQDYMTKPKTKAEMAAIIENLQSDFEPGTSSSYSNSAFILLGYIIEDLSGKTYAEQLAQKITEPIGLKCTAYGQALADSPNHARSYRKEKRKWKPSWETHMSIPHGAGAITSTTNDLTRFFHALFNQKLINASSLAQMKTFIGPFGHGIFKIPFYDLSAFGHGGNIDAFDSNAAYFENEDVAVAITANASNMSMNEIMIGVLSIVFDKPYEVPDYSMKPIDLSATALKQYEGIFSSEQLPLKITITVNEGKLTAQATGQSTLELTPFSEMEFRFDPAGIVIVFDQKEDQVDHGTFTLRQGGGTFKFTRE